LARAGGRLVKLVGGAGAALGVKVATGFVVAAVAATAAAAASEVASTGSVNPAEWGQHVREQVATCKFELAEGRGGIGPCVSTFAKQQGAAASATHHASPPRGSAHGGAPADAADKSKDKNESSDHGGAAKDNSSKSHDDASGKDKNPEPRTSSDREPTDPPLVVHTWLPPPPP
jgi:hypothetical protein